MYPCSPCRAGRAARAGALRRTASVALAVASLMLSPGVGARPAKGGCRLTGPVPGFRLRCTSVIVGRGATADGSVILAHNEDLGDSAVHHYVAVPRRSHAPGEVVTLWSGATLPQVPVTWAYTATTLFDVAWVPGDVTSGVNERQVAVVNDSAKLRDAGGSSASGGRVLWSEFSRLALERAETARQAVRVIGELAEKYGLGGDSATMFGVTDATEGWWIEITRDGQWVAERVPDDGASVRANAFRVGVVDLGNPDRFMGSADLVSHAEARGWYARSDGPFDFARAYGDARTAAAAWNTHREERVRDLLGTFPRAVKPSDLMALLRDHYEGTSRDLTGGYALGSPHGTDEYTVCRRETEVAVVFQSRSWLPPEIGAVSWRAMATPCTSPFVPWYLGGTYVPTSYRTGSPSRKESSAYWAFRNLFASVDDDYAGRIGPVRKTWRDFEAGEASDQARMEAAALKLHGTDPGAARRMLTAFSDTRALLACQRARALVSR